MSGRPELQVEIAGERLLLLADKALYWPAAEALLIADLHIGKAATYRALGQPVPHGTTAGNLQRLDALLARYPCRRLILLGDFLHARQAQGAATLAALRRWRERHAGLDIVLVRGNHDRRAGDPAAALAIETLAEPCLLGPFALQHEPTPHPSHHVLAGHLHPVFRLRGRGRQQLRLPCFCLDEGVTLLPAFGAFTGGMAIHAAPGRRLYGVLDGGVWPLTSE
ncbi:ligase-associated DNA damage response endonuclease PdeM [Phytopseudomonas dryadis]|uniref:Ligase-associated DNA damage response endonuclease PdeM n=1 Tax=Phytopseudomonas dryadis TaxID=2487520 RepID=A0ABY1Z9R8_9GAMM|nr:MULTISPECIES: ligase-associated DNA damage response endonuclease PdeM [Pseudomonas]TBV08341.1 ligase-associated DNA damage response endonuclease PdeM [Pseudomonas dryadis]TBV19657.1 ligase-associated DNA damage response endonuclease PdeM [Pseudomonas sp. FRB 230]